MVAPAGAGPWPQITLGDVLPASQIITGTSPPGPHRCGSTTCRVKAIATPASKALPPRSSTPIPTAVPIQCVDATTPKVPSISGRVVKGPALMLAMGCSGKLTAAVSEAATLGGPDCPFNARSCIGDLALAPAAV